MERTGYESTVNVQSGYQSTSYEQSDRGQSVWGQYTAQQHQHPQREWPVVCSIIGAIIVIVFSFMPMWIHWEPEEYLNGLGSNLYDVLEIEEPETIPKYWGIIFTIGVDESDGFDSRTIESIGVKMTVRDGIYTEAMMGRIVFPQKIKILVIVLAVLGALVIVRWISDKKVYSLFDIVLPIGMIICLVWISCSDYMKTLFDMLEKRLGIKTEFSFSWWAVIIGIAMVCIQMIFACCYYCTSKRRKVE